MSTAPHPDPREVPDPEHRPPLDTRPFFIETTSSRPPEGRARDPFGHKAMVTPARMSQSHVRG